MSEADIKKNQQPLTAKVVGNNMEKTVRVEITDIVKDPQYKKYLKLTREILAHDENNECKIGDIVLISQTKPYSKRKAWKVEKIVRVIS